MINQGDKMMNQGDDNEFNYLEDYWMKDGKELEEDKKVDFDNKGIEFILGKNKKLSISRGSSKKIDDVDLAFIVKKCLYLQPNILMLSFEYKTISISKFQRNSFYILPQRFKYLKRPHSIDT